MVVDMFAEPRALPHCGRKADLARTGLRRVHMQSELTRTDESQRGCRSGTMGTMVSAVNTGRPGEFLVLQLQVVRVTEGSSIAT